MTEQLPLPLADMRSRPAKDGTQPVRDDVGVGYLPVGEHERKVTAPPIVSTACECDLRDRRWNPNTGKCETCRCRYVDPEVGIPAHATIVGETTVIPTEVETIEATIVTETATVIPIDMTTIATSSATAESPSGVYVVDVLAEQASRMERTCWPSGSGASFSADRRFRFELWRDTGIEYGPSGGPVAVIIGVNPSDANEIKNDPTITKDVEFAKRWGCAHVLKVNANAFIATDPDDMRKAFAQGVNIVGNELMSEGHRVDNNSVIRKACGVALLSKGKLVLAWGKNIAPERQKEIYETIIRYCGVTPMCLGINKDGTPKHTGRIAYSTELVPWTCP